MSRGRLAGAFVALAVVSTVSSPALGVGAARAQDGGRDLQDDEARGLFGAGRAAFSRGEFGDALGYFQRAYDLSHRPAMLFNIGTCLDRLRRDREALASFEAYLTEVPDASNRLEVEGRIEALRGAIARAEHPRPGHPPEGSRDASPADEDASALPVDPADGGERREARAAEGDSARLWTWVAAGGVAVFGGLAAGFWLAGDGVVDDLAASCGDVGCSASDIDGSSLGTYDTLASVMWVAAAATAVAAVTLFFVEAGGSGDDGVELAVGIGPGSLVARGRF